MKTIIEIKNFKNIKNITEELKTGNVYLVKGRNNTGKSSFIQAFLNAINAKVDSKQLSFNANAGSIKLTVYDDNNNVYTVNCEITDKDVKFTFINDKGIIDKKVTSIRSFFKYKHLDIEEFLKLSDTEEGKKKQMQMFLEMLSDDIITEYKRLEGEEKILYDKRTEVNNNAKYMQNILKSYAYTEEERGVLEEMDALQEEIKSIKTYFEEIDKDYREAKMQKELIEKELSYLNGMLNSINDEIESLEEKLKILKESRNNIINKIAEINSKQIKVVNEEEYAFIKERYEKAIAMENIIKDVLVKEENAKKFTAQYEQLRIESEKLTREIEDIREAKKKLIYDNVKIDNIDIVDEAIYYVDGDKRIPFSSNHLSTSKSIITLIKMLYNLNSFPFIFVNRGESLDNESLAAIHRFAEENDCAIIIEKVTNDNFGIEVIYKE